MDESSWDAVFYDEETSLVYRLACKRLTIRDGAAIDQAHVELAGRELDDALLLTLRGFPLLLYGTARAERAVLDAPPQLEGGTLVVPDDLDWQPFRLTEDEFLNFGELLGQIWLGAVLLRNPHRSAQYETLKKRAAPPEPALPSGAPTNGSATDAPAFETT